MATSKLPVHLEDALNDIAVIRTVFETLEAFPDDPQLHAELASPVHEARGQLARRLVEAQRALCGDHPGSTPPDLREFMEQLLCLALDGRQRSQLDQMMCVEVFEAASKGVPKYQYEFRPQHPIDELRTLSPPAFIARVFDDLLETVADDRNYADRLTFDRNVFQKLVAVIFCSYIATDPLYYGGDSPP
jgi:hypothetical protein